MSVQTEIRRRRVQLDRLAQMRVRAEEEHDTVRYERIGKSIEETEQRLVELEGQRGEEESGQSRRRKG